jgi:hypothetical protein
LTPGAAATPRADGGNALKPMSNFLSAVVPIVVTVGLFATPAVGEPSAIVEDVEAAGSKLSFMDYVEPGDVVRLAAGERLVIGYFASCMQETIIGGTVTVGVKESSVDGGDVRKEKVPCDAGQVELAEGQANNSGVVAFRGTGDVKRHGGDAARPDMTLYGASPLVRSPDAGILELERIDRPGTPVEIAVQGGANDMAERGIALEPGGVYRARLRAGGAERELIFDVDAFAEPGDQPKLSRLIRF